MITSLNWEVFIHSKRLLAKPAFLFYSDARRSVTHPTQESKRKRDSYLDNRCSLLNECKLVLLVLVHCQPDGVTKHLSPMFKKNRENTFQIGEELSCGIGGQSVIASNWQHILIIDESHTLQTPRVRHQINCKASHASNREGGLSQM